MFIRSFLAMISCCPFLHKFSRKGAKNNRADLHSELQSPEETPKAAPQQPSRLTRHLPHGATSVLAVGTQTEPRAPTVDLQGRVNSIKRSSSPTSEYDFFDCQSEFSNSAPVQGAEVFHEVTSHPEPPPPVESWRSFSLWEMFGWGSGRTHSQKSTQRCVSLERGEDRDQPQFHESDPLEGGEERTASMTTIDAGQSRMLTAFSNLMHHQKGPSTSFQETTQERLPCGSTFERREESCTHGEAQEKWEPADATRYRIRSKSYLKTRIKEECKGAFYEVIHSDLISFSQKQTHVAQLFDLPKDPYHRTPEELQSIAEYGLPTLLIVNMQLPVYQPSLFGACDGPGHSFVFYCVLREHFNPQTFQNQAALSLFQRFIRECRNQTQYRIKLIPKFINVDEWAQKGPLTATEHRLVHQFNEKPILTRPYQHFFHESNYFEIDVDVHSWLYVARKAFWSLLPRMHEVITEVALLIQGNRAEDLPEHIVAVARVYRVNLSKFRYFPDLLKQLQQPEETETENKSPSHP